MKHSLWIFALLFALTGVGTAQEESKFIRYVSGEDPAQDGELQIAVTEFISADKQFKVTLYGAVHIGDPEYYAHVQKDLDGYDVVLYEGVKTGSQVNAETKILNVIQKGFGNVLGLSFQKDGIDYTRPNLRHADIDIEQLQESMQGEQLTPFGGMSGETTDKLLPLLDLAGDFIGKFLASNPQFQAQLKTQLAQGLANADMRASLNPQMYQAIVIDRNKIVIDVLQKQMQEEPAKTNIGIFYGAGHNEDLTERLQTLGFTRSNQRWVTGWKIGNGASEEIERRPLLEDEELVPQDQLEPR